MKAADARTAEETSSFNAIYESARTGRVVKVPAPPRPTRGPALPEAIR